MTAYSWAVQADVRIRMSPPLRKDSLISNSCIQRKGNSLKYSLLWVLGQWVLVQYVDITGKAFKVKITRN